MVIRRGGLGSVSGFLAFTFRRRRAIQRLVRYSAVSGHVQSLGRMFGQEIWQGLISGVMQGSGNLMRKGARKSSMRLGVSRCGECQARARIRCAALRCLNWLPPEGFRVAIPINRPRRRKACGSVLGPFRTSRGCAGPATVWRDAAQGEPRQP